MSKDADKKKQIPINKYSIYELKSEIDQSIIAHLEKEDFIENHTNSNLKIVVGLITLTCTAVAYFYPKPFPLNYNAILFSVIGYGIFSTIYWYLDKHYIKNTFFFFFFAHQGNPSSGWQHQGHILNRLNIAVGAEFDGHVFHFQHTVPPYLLCWP